MIDEGDPVALELKARFRNLPMPNLGLNELDVAAVIDYMAEQISTATPQIKAGAVKAYVTFGPTRGPGRASSSSWTSPTT